MPAVLWQELTEFLKGDLQHLFDEQGIDKTRYEHKVDFKVCGAGASREPSCCQLCFKHTVQLQSCARYLVLIRN